MYPFTSTNPSLSTENTMALCFGRYAVCMMKLDLIMDQCYYIVIKHDIVCLDVARVPRPESKTIV